MIYLLGCAIAGSLRRCLEENNRYPSRFYFLVLMPIFEVFQSSSDSRQYFGERPNLRHSILAAGDENAVVIAEHCHRLADQIRPEDTLARNIEIVAINQGEEGLH